MDQKSLNDAQQNHLRKVINRRIYQLTDTPGARPALFRSAYATLMQRYNVESYHFIKQRDLQDAIRFISKWGG